MLDAVGLGDALEIRWTPWEGGGPPPEPWDLVLIRVDEFSTEWAGARGAVERGELGLLGDGQVSKYDVRLYLRHR